MSRIARPNPDCDLPHQRSAQSTRPQQPSVPPGAKHTESSIQQRSSQQSWHRQTQAIRPSTASLPLLCCSCTCRSVKARLINICPPCHCRAPGLVLGSRLHLNVLDAVSAREDGEAVRTAWLQLPRRIGKTTAMPSRTRAAFGTSH